MAPPTGTKLTHSLAPVPGRFTPSAGPAAPSSNYDTPSEALASPTSR